MTKRLDLGLVRRLMFPPVEMTVADAATELGVSQSTAACARDVLILIEEEGLTHEEWTKLLEAVGLASEMEIQKARDIINPILDRHFTLHPNMNPTQSRAYYTRKLKEAVTRITDAMQMAGDVVVPKLPDDDAEEILAELDAAMKVVSRFRNSIQRG